MTHPYSPTPPGPSPGESAPGVESLSADTQDSADAALAASATQALAQGFASQVARWARLRQAPQASVGPLRLAAAELSLATSSGHVCLLLAHSWAARGQVAAMDPPTAAADASAVAQLRAALRCSGLVGTPQAPRDLPLVLDDDDRLYLNRYFDYETRLARRLMRAARAAPQAVAEPTRVLLQSLFDAASATAAGQTDWQMAAAALALRQRLIVISGGPGTGKTSTVAKLLVCLLAQDPGSRIALAAPTGKAAARLTEALRQRALHLPQALQDKLPQESSTLHRLLGVTPAGGGFVHHAGNPLAIDVVVIDEASMLDLALATRVFEAVPDGARIILLGDKDQLAAVESGSVFAELSADPTLSDVCREALAALCGQAADSLQPSAPAQPGALRDAVVWFSRNFRFAADSGIGRLAADIQQGRAEPVLEGLRAGADASVVWLPPPQSAAAAQGHLDEPASTALVAGYGPYFDALARDGGDVAAVSQAFDRFRVLCAVNQGPRGMVAVNRLLDALARGAASKRPAGLGPARDPQSAFYPGRPVMVLRNDHPLRLFNGDIGITLADAHGELKVFFPSEGGGYRALAPERLPEHQSAFATTVHKSQGSEFDAVLLLLPEQRSPVLTRELLYTAVTRARAQVTLAASAEILSAAIRSPTRRHSGLQARLHEAARLADSASE